MNLDEPATRNVREKTADPGINDSDFVISRSDEQSVLQKTLFATLTGLAWLGWVYLWLPLLTLLAWWVGIDRAWKYLVVNSTESNLWDTRLLLGIACVCAVATMSWMQYNRIRFGSNDRRRSVEDAVDDDIAFKLGGTPKMSRELRRNRHSILHIDGFGNPVSVDSDGHSALGTDTEHGYDSRPMPSDKPDEEMIGPDNL